jgi:hypothetical protein
VYRIRDQRKHVRVNCTHSANTGFLFFSCFSLGRVLLLMMFFFFFRCLHRSGYWNLLMCRSSLSASSKIVLLVLPPFLLCACACVCVCECVSLCTRVSSSRRWSLFFVLFSVSACYMPPETPRIIVTHVYLTTFIAKEKCSYIYIYIERERDACVVCLPVSFIDFFSLSSSHPQYPSAGFTAHQ